MSRLLCEWNLPSAPSPPSGVTVSQNGVDSVQVSWTPPSGEPTVTGYIIYYQQQDGGHNGSVMTGATATTATVTELMTGATYSITMVATSSTLPSTVTAAVNVTIGMIDGTQVKCVYTAKKWVVVLNIRCGYLSCNVAIFLPPKRYVYDINKE